MKYMLAIILMSAIVLPGYAQNDIKNPYAKPQGLLKGNSQLLIRPGKPITYFDAKSNSFKKIEIKGSTKQQDPKQ